MPLVEGTVVGYSPPLDSARDGDDSVGVAEAEDAEFPMERQRGDQPLFRILWDGRSYKNGGGGGDDDDSDDDGDGDGVRVGDCVGYTEDVTLPELLLALVDDYAQPSSKQRRDELK